MLLVACGGGGGASSSTTPRNQPPTANFSLSINERIDPLTVQLDATTSSDSDGSISSYAWQLGDGSSATGATISHTYSTTGTYNISLTVTDNQGASSSLAQSTTISSNVIAAISIDSAAAGQAPFTVNFDASASQVLGATNNQPQIVSYQWDFGDGGSDTGATASHTFTELGAFTTTLTVTDNSGDSDTATILIQTAFTVSGTISTASGSVVDIDVNDPSRQNKNDPRTVFRTNNTSIDAQALPNPAILNGFVSAVGAGPAPFGPSNFADDSDQVDYYSAHLLAGQFVSLRVSDFDPSSPSSNNIDLELYDSNLTLLKFSNSLTEFESIAVDNNADYFIRVRAMSGISKYVMNIGTTSLASGLRAYGSSADFIEGEAVVKMKSPQALASRAHHSLPSLALSHKDNSRAALNRFAIANAKTVKALQSQLSANSVAITQKNHAKLATLEHIHQLRSRADVEYAEPNYRVRANRIPSDSFYFLQSHYPQINLPQAWDITTGTPATGSIVVAVLDSGVVFDHEDLLGQFVDSSDDYDFVRDISNSGDGDGIDNDPDDPGDGALNNPDSWHGTHVAGTIAAASNNNRGVAGVSWGAKIMPIRVLGRDGGSTYDVEQGIRFAAGLPNDSGTTPSRRADIINLSLGGGSFSQASQALFDQVRSNGIIVVASAGNENTASPSYPASYNHVISVSAVDLVNNLAPYSNFGFHIDIAAPGGDLSVDRNADGYGDGILSTLIDDSSGNQEASYSFYQGTSMAAPHVAGVAALMKALHPTLSPAEFDSALQNGVLTNDIGAPGRDDEFGFGIIDALKSVQQAQLLAGGSATGSIIASPTRVDFGAVLTTQTVNLTPIGSSPPRVTNVSKNAPWLNVNASAAAPDGSGSYSLTVDRTALEDATYTDNVVFSLDNGNQLTIPVSMQVQNSASLTGDAGFLFVLLLDADTFTSVKQLNIDVQDGQYNYTFNNVPFGEYIVVAGSDIDNDFVICGPGESCGRYPTNDRPLRLVVNQDMENLDFLASVIAQVINSTTTDNRANGYQRVQAQATDQSGSGDKSL